MVSRWEWGDLQTTSLSPVRAPLGLAFKALHSLILDTDFAFFFFMPCTPSPHTQPLSHLYGGP